MRRPEILAEIARRPWLVVANIGYPSRELFAAADRPENFYMLGSMGLASSIGLGLAVSQPRPVCAIDGDGSVLMNLGTLATIAREAPPNYCLVIIDNKSYGSTGGQPTCTAGRADLAEIARAAGNIHVVRAGTIAGLNRALNAHNDSCTIIIADAEPGNAAVPIIALSAQQIKERFMAQVRKDS
jgi:sulfopyruvate decarboxylase subunit beta